MKGHIARVRGCRPVAVKRWDGVSGAAGLVRPAGTAAETEMALAKSLVAISDCVAGQPVEQALRAEKHC
ncbi:hypothetical protein YM3MPS_16870 [Mycobacterium pseudoshottsii]|uniref:Uncharacterized protein n=1 Tax=Mycobacterium pseudoshottsii TaxID=265949 RepID=A0A9N7LT88_9MYCO|nr:hypothetical protein DL240490_01841 [Mycobacterium marinum]BBA87317.1 hypothetical protein MPSD_17160 [Mycobacterium pseudoshottsii JCM 15466]BDN81479.1 hypothetical protein NJB1907Z4_C16940 [Mycobacterium pseudoshottsii]BEH75884.1 hypothetical protein YM3MPS_16870 [Mycobacterium pseudoshottsii]